MVLLSYGSFVMLKLCYMENDNKRDGVADVLVEGRSVESDDKEMV
jgi:hypothetical protein